MIEKLIYLKSVDPLLLYGANNQHLELIKRFFPKIKLIARGDQLKAIGPAGEITRFEKKMEELFNHLDKIQPPYSFGAGRYLGGKRTNQRNRKSG
jgi:phosphate starvation-inducible PhoH-like protein